MSKYQKSIGGLMSIELDVLQDNADKTELQIREAEKGIEDPETTEDLRWALKRELNLLLSKRQHYADLLAAREVSAAA
jgi:hypothetical protein